MQQQPNFEEAYMSEEPIKSKSHRSTGRSEWHLLNNSARKYYTLQAFKIFDYYHIYKQRICVHKLILYHDIVKVKHEKTGVLCNSTGLRYDENEEGVHQIYL